MNADLQGALNQLSKSWSSFEHNGHPMTKEQVRMVLVAGIERGYKTTSDFKPGEVDEILKLTSPSPPKS